MLRYIALMLGGVLIGWSLSLLPARVAEDKSVARPLPTPQEALVLDALDRPSELDYGAQPFQDVITYLAQKHRIAIELDSKGLQQACVRSDTPITCSLKGITLRSLLRVVLGELDLTYVVGDGYLLITSKTEADNKLRMQIYPVGDLVMTDSEFRTPLDPCGKDGSYFHNLIDVITSVVEPTTWDELGGPGSVSPHGSSRALAVSQTDEVHEEIAALLTGLRRVRDKQIAAAKSLNRFGRAQPCDTNGQGELEVRAYRFFQVSPPAVPGAPAVAPQPPTADAAAAEELAAAKLDACTKVVAKLVPEMIAPESWEPAGPGQIRAKSGVIVVRQTADVQHRVGKLIYEMMLPGLASGWYPLAAPAYRCIPPVPLPPPPIGARWPQEAEPLPRGAEARLSAALEEKCELDFTDQPLSDVIDGFARRHNIQIRMDHKALADAGVARDAPITHTLRGIKLKIALQLMLDELDLAYAIRDEVLLVTSKAEAEKMMVVKVYPVFDLVVRRPGASARAPALDFSSLMENITATLAPASWDEVGGRGAIRAFTNAGALVISQTTEVHETIVRYLEALRDVAATQR
jgi:hypothetical protein